MIPRSTALVALAAACAGCIAPIPKRTLDARAALPEKLPALAPCALVHLLVDDDLSNGANGWFRGTWKLSYATFLIRRAEGVVLVDAAVGDTLAADLDAAPFWFRALFNSARPARPLAPLLAEAGVRPEEVTHVLLTHAHWDHTGGLPQLPNARVVMAEADAAWVLADPPPPRGFPVAAHFAAARDRIERLRFDGPSYDGFDASKDVFGDGSIVAVPTPGHSRGATSYFLNSGDGKRWLFVGDAAWVKEGVEEPAMRGLLAGWIADTDAALTADSLARIHAVHAAGAAAVVTTHDPRTWRDVPRCAGTAPAN